MELGQVVKYTTNEEKKVGTGGEKWGEEEQWKKCRE